MKKSKRYLIATVIGIFVAIALMTLAPHVFRTDLRPHVPARTTAAELAQLANFTHIRVEGDFYLEVTQVQDYNIEYLPLSDTDGDLGAKVEDDTLIITGYGNRVDTDSALLRIGVPVLDTLQVYNVPQTNVSNFTAPLLNIRLIGVGSFTLQNSVLGNLDLSSEGNGVVNLRGNTLTAQNLRIESQSNLNITE
jgi:hypothetical protein